MFLTEFYLRELPGDDIVVHSDDIGCSVEHTRLGVKIICVPVVSFLFFQLGL
jgi:hypothetical protein